MSAAWAAAPNAAAVAMPRTSALTWIITVLRSAFADQRRQHHRPRLRHRRLEHPAQAELQVVRRDVAEFHRIEAGIYSVIRLDVAGDGVAEIEIAVGGLGQSDGICF